MKTFIAVVLVMMSYQIASANNTTRSPASASATICGVLSGECLNGGSCAHFITTNNGEHPVVGSNPKVARQLGELVEQNVQATGHFSRNGFVASSISEVAACDRGPAIAQ